MKYGKSLMELAAEIERQNAVKKDFVLDTRRLSMETENGGLTLTMDGADITPLDVNPIAHRQIGTWAKIPAAYYDKMQSQAPALLAQNVNTWLHTVDSPTKRMVRTLDSTARAFLSDRYRRLDNMQVAEAVLPIIGNIPDARVESCEITDRRMYIKIVNPKLEAEVVPGDIVQAGIIISNSETGQGSVSVSPLVYRLVCSNGMVVNAAAARKYHVGREVDAGDNYELYSSETIQADDHAFILKMQDTVRAAVDDARFQRVVEQMREASGIKITSLDIPAVVELTAKEYGMTQEEGKGVLLHLIQGGDLSLYGLANAVTRHAQDVESYDRSVDLETVGYSIMTINPAVWARINTTDAY